MKTNQMNGLYPIIRRVRRPLLPVEVPTDSRPTDANPAPAVVPAQEDQIGAAVDPTQEDQTVIVPSGEQKKQGNKRGQVNPAKSAK
jgi:hypothetical protein